MATDSERARAWDMYLSSIIRQTDIRQASARVDAVQAVDELLECRDRRFGDGNEKPVVKAEEPALPEIPLCPWCDQKCEVESAHSKVWVCCTHDGCEAVGPTKTNIADAIAAWNSVRG